MFKTVNPENNKVINKYYFFSEKEIKSKLTISKKIFEEWKKTSFHIRVKYIDKLSSIILKNKDNMANMITKEMGKPIKQSKSEINKSVNLCKFYCNNIKSFNFIKTINKKNTPYYKSYIRYEPLGTILGITPWNYPIWQIIRFSIPNLILGNVVLVKPSISTAGCSILLEKLFSISGFPTGLFQVLLIKESNIKYIISSDIVHGVSFTGSTNSGKILGAISGMNIKKSIMELGGNDAFVVLKDTKNSINKISKLATFSRLSNTGQSCISAKRFIVDNSLLNDFIDLVINEMEKFKRGDLYNINTKIGYISRNDLSNKLDNQYKKILYNGGKICLNTKRNKNFFSPSLLKIDKENKISYEEELFGPIALIIPFHHEKDIVDIINNTIYGLGTSIWTNDIDKVEKLTCEINSGMIFINKVVESSPIFPFGGIKKSGYGRELSIYSINEFSNCKTIVVDRL
ncbi:aldehyde dehydrogenase family protein [Blattabacterium cuenoti]|uniref:aldehyde dehydrogenase family protein n=1 Tax=Blattabacterium cuenoti TaxID=1653831 RepID=UPI001EEB0E0D|nr:aldehyde dehydrogenase family protein [Blattabacterium cuenoti]